MNSNNFPKGCFLPLNAIAVHPQGFPHFCLTSTLKGPGSLAEFESERLSIHHSLLRGEWPESCIRCFNKEKRGLQSRRTRTWQRKSKMYGKEKAIQYVHQQEKPTIRHLEISFSNVCNLTCVMCTSEFSTSWARPDAKAEEAGLEFRNFTKPFRKVAQVSKTLLAEVLAHVEDFDLIIVKGGEPSREPLCLDFLEAVGVKTKGSEKLNVFLQSNGTRPPKEWLPRLQHLNLEIGFSIDGLGTYFDWIRGGSYSKVMEHFELVCQASYVRSMSVDFTLSAFNCFHLPEFFSFISELHEKFPKFRECPVFQWVQQPYASPLALDLESRIQVRSLIEPIFKKKPKLFLNHENLLQVLTQPQLDREKRSQTIRWHDYLNDLRGYTLPDDQRIKQSMRNDL